MERAPSRCRTPGSPTALRATGRRVTPQRVILHRALQRIGRHATAEDVMREARDQLPSLSLPTVYAALDLFDELGVARRVDAGRGPALYDPRTDDHGHFVCRRLRAGRRRGRVGGHRAGDATAAARSGPSGGRRPGPPRRASARSARDPSAGLERNIDTP